MSETSDASPALVTTTVLDGVGIITINNPPVNALSPGVPEAVRTAVEGFTQDASVQAIVLIGSGRTFIAGADIKEFSKITAGKKRDVSPIRSMLAALESCP